MRREKRRKEKGEDGERFLATLGMTSPSSFEGVDGAAGRGSLENITLHPNPTTGELRIENGELRIKSVEVYDVYGRKLQFKIVNLKSEIVIDKPSQNHQPS